MHVHRVFIIIFGGLINRHTGETRLYINGKLEKVNGWNAVVPSRDYGSTTWKIGIAVPDNTEWGWPAKGLIRDVRIYKGALTDAEVAALAQDAK